VIRPISAEAVLTLVQTELDGAAYPVAVERGPEPGGWPLIAVVASPTGPRVVLGEFDVEPLLDLTPDSLAAVIVNGVRALFDEFRAEP
jgi:hypothetical protein